MNFLRPGPARSVAVALALAWLAPRGARAEDSISYKYADYQEYGGRIAVQTQGAHIEKDLGTATKLKLVGILDSIAGATPSGQPAPAGSTQVPLSRLTEYRKAWNADLSHQLPRTNVALGVGNSRESDYVSTGLSLNTVTDFNQKNTTLLVGVAGTEDRIKVFYQPAWAKKKTHDVIVGVTQLLDPQTSVGFNLSWGRQRGYLSDPYKLVQKNTELFPGVVLPLTFAENRPGERDKWIALATANRAFPGLGGALDATYRFYHDTYGTEAHTLDLAWFQRLGDRLVLRPAVRAYQQGAADFYRYRFDGTSIVPQSGPPRPQGPFYSSDFRLSSMRTYTFGLKAVFTVKDWLQLDATIERYDMEGRDGVTPDSAYADARILTLGIKLAW